VLVVHLTGCPIDIEPIAALCAERNLVLIEDCAQGLGAIYQGQSIGTFGRFGCFSLNDQKHITSGEGGFVLMGSEEDFYLCHNYQNRRGSASIGSLRKRIGGAKGAELRHIFGNRDRDLSLRMWVEEQQRIEPQRLAFALCSGRLAGQSDRPRAVSTSGS
jgi:hypothetical protein